MSSEQFGGAGRGDGADSAAWSEQYCLTDWCRGGRWLVRPDGRARDLWQVAASLDDAPWSVAATEVVCPLCGEALAAHIEGVGDIDAEPPAGILGFLHALGRAA